MLKFHFQVSRSLAYKQFTIYVNLLKDTKFDKIILCRLFWIPFVVESEMPLMIKEEY